MGLEMKAGTTAMVVHPGDLHPTEQRPLLTFIVGAYKHEAYIREAVQCALSQTYTPLEIILTDDCSPDGTFDIIREMATAYRGPHRIIINRNATNLGLGAHVNYLTTIVSGELVIGSSGDDVSDPSRVQAVYEEWIRQGKRPLLLHSDYEVINERGSIIPESFPRNTFSGASKDVVKDIASYLLGSHPAHRVNGATLAWSPALFRQAGPLYPGVVFEDKAICFRALITGAFAYVPGKRVRYRMHADNLYSRRASERSRINQIRKNIQQSATQLSRWQAVLKGYEADVRCFVGHGVITEEQGAAIRKEIDFYLRLNASECGVYSGPPLAAVRALGRRLWMRPSLKYLWSTAKHWLFMSADRVGLLPGGRG